MREIFEHTADAGIRVESNTMTEALNELSLAFTEIITGGNLPDDVEQFNIGIKSDTLDSLIVNYLSHLIYLFDTEGFLVKSVNLGLELGEINTISGILSGDFYDENKHGYGVEVKAVSYHMLNISIGPPSKINVILDL